MSDYDLEAQRASVLHADLRLRTDYPHLRAEVYEIPPFVHAIFVPKDQLDLPPPSARGSPTVTPGWARNCASSTSVRRRGPD